MSPVMLLSHKQTPQINFQKHIELKILSSPKMNNSIDIFVRVEYPSNNKILASFLHLFHQIMIDIFLKNNKRLPLHFLSQCNSSAENGI